MINKLNHLGSIRQKCYNPTDEYWMQWSMRSNPMKQPSKQGLAVYDSFVVCSFFSFFLYVHLLVIFVFYSLFILTFNLKIPSSPILSLYYHVCIFPFSDVLVVQFPHNCRFSLSRHQNKNRKLFNE